MTNEEKRYMNVVRVICAFGVVLLHSNEAIWMFSYEPYWISATAITMLFYPAVPCFIMMSGALLIDYSDRYSTSTFIKKRLEKTLIPYIAWCLIGIVYLIFRKALSVDRLSVKTVVRMIINNEVLSVYWFFTTILVIYLLTPVLTVIPKDKRKTIYEYIIVSIFTLNVLAPFLWSMAGFGAFQIQMPITTMCLYYVVGYYIDKYDIPRKVRYTIYVLSIVGFLTLVVGTISASYKAGSLVQTYMGGANLPSVLMSVGVFGAFKWLPMSHVVHGDIAEKLYRIVRLFVNETLGIYLVHWFVLNEIKVHFGLIYSDFMYRIPFGIIAFFTSWMIVKVLKMIPVVKHIVP